MISVIIPMYNAERTIIRCLKSVIYQTYETSIEIIIINDGSTDSSNQIVQNFIHQNKNFNIILLNKPNGGVSSARNLGLKTAKGDFIALLDSDDEWFPDKIKIQIDVFNNFTNFSFLGCLIYEPSSSVKGLIKEITLSKLITKNYFQPSTVIFKKNIVEEIGFFDESQHYAEEGNYFMRIAHSSKCALIYLQLVLYDQGKIGFGESGLSANLKEMEKGELRNLKFAYKNKYISAFKYMYAVFFSILKFIRRVLIVKMRNYFYV